MRLPGFVGPTYQDGTNAEVCLNLFPEEVESPSAQNPYARATYEFQSVDGLKPLIEIPDTDAKLNGGADPDLVIS